MSALNTRFRVNTCDNVYAITTLSPMKWYKALLLRLVFFLRRFGLFTENAESLKHLSFIHFARWVVVGRDQFPYLGDGQPREHLEYDYLIFCSNFNGTWDQYIDAFSHTIPIGMDRTFGASIKYPKSIPTTPFKNYIRANQVDTDYYYSAYPHASTNDVKRATHLMQELDKFAAKAAQLPPQKFLREYHKFLVSVQHDLAKTGPA